MKFKKILLICCAALAAFSVSTSVARQATVDVSAAERKVKSIFDGGTYTIDPKFADYTIENGNDVSVWQGNINWAGLKKGGTQFAFIRLGYRGTSAEGGIYIDDKFETNIKNATAAGVPVGVYFFSQAITEAEAKAEAEYCIAKLKNHKIDLPIIMDFEYRWIDGAHGGRLYDAHLSKDKTTKVINAFLDTCTNAGYESMLYANKNTLTECMNASQIANKHQIWLAHYTSKTTYEGTYQYWQYSDTGSSKSVESEYIDCDFRFVPNKVTALAFEKSSIELNVGASVGYTVNETPKYNYDTITVTSSDPAVACVIDGKVYGVSRGTATITAKSKGNKTAVCKVTVKEPLSNYTVNISDSPVYNANEIKPQISVSKETAVSGTVKAKGSIYSQPSTKSSVAAGVAKNERIQLGGTVTISSTKFYYAVNSAGKKGFIPATNVTTENDTIMLDAEKEIKAEYSNNINAGTATVTVTPVSDTLSGSVSKEFTIAPCSIKSCTAAKLLPQQYTGSALVPNVKLYFGERRLTRGIDYTLSYSNNVDIGTAKITAAGMGNFSGSIDIDFEIVKEGGQIETQQEIGGITISGIDGIGANITDVSITFVSDDGAEYDALVDDDGRIMLETLPAGKYTATVALKNCAPRVYEIEVTNSNPAQLNAKLNLYGDVTGDGEIDLLDYLRVNALIRHTIELDDYSIATADVTKDGDVDLLDYLRINAHIRQIQMLW